MLYQSREPSDRFREKSGRLRSTPSPTFHLLITTIRMKKPATFALARQYGVVLGRAHPVASYSTEKLLSTRPNNGSRIRHHNMLTPSSSSLIATGGKQQPISPATASWPVRFTAATIQAPALFASVRHFSSLTKKRKKINPFKILKVKRQTPYANVKTVFLKIAM